MYSTWKLATGDEKKLKTYYDKFVEYCKPKSKTFTIDICSSRGFRKKMRLLNSL